MNQNQTEIRKSPFVFLKMLVAIELFFALLPIVLATISTLRQNYETSPLANTIPYSLLTALVIASLQILLLILAFIGWYLPIYKIDQNKIIYRRSQLSEAKQLLTGTIYEISIRQGPLARRFDYGTLVIMGTGGDGSQLIKDIPNPGRYRQLLLDMAESEPIAAEEGLPKKQVHDIIQEGEGQFVEYKSSLMWDYHRQAVNKDLYVPVMKNLIAFMNTQGGILIIGVDDDGQLLGLEPDLKSLRKPNVDGYENTFNQAFNNMIGVEFRQYVDVAFPEIEDKAICAVTVRPSPEPVFLNFKGKESFYIRAGNASQPLTISQATRYIDNHFNRGAA